MTRKAVLLAAVFAAATFWPSLAGAQPAPQGFAVGILGGFESWSLDHVTPSIDANLPAQSHGPETH